MFEAIPTLLRLLHGTQTPLVEADYLTCWRPDEVQHCLSAGLLRPAPPARYLPCEWCGEVQEVVVMEDRHTGRLHAYTPCGEGGPVPVPLERLKRWEVSVPSLLDVLCAAAGLSGKREELVPHHLWRLGRRHWTDTSWSVFFARGQLPTQQFAPTTVVLTTSAAPPSSSSPTVIELSEVLGWDGDTLRVDHQQIESQLAVAQPARSGAGRRPIPKRGSRVAIIEALTNELQQHLRAARDYAKTTRDRTGTPELLPRPTMKLLAKKVGTHQSTVTRCFEDESARELNFLWEVAADLDRLLVRT